MTDHQHAPPAPAPAAPFLSVCSRHQRPNPSCPSCVPAPAASPAPAAEQWQPIETAPKDFTPVLLAWKWSTDVPGHSGIDVVLARWNCRTHAHLARQHGCPNEKDCNMGWDNYAGEMIAWMPLPAPPSKAPVPTPAASPAKSRFTEWLLGYEGRQRLTVKDAEAVADKAAELFWPVTPAAAPLAEGSELPDSAGIWWYCKLNPVIVAPKDAYDHTLMATFADGTRCKVDGLTRGNWSQTPHALDWHPAQHPAGGAERSAASRAADWIASDVGRQTVERVVAESDEAVRQLQAARRVDPKALNKPMMAGVAEREDEIADPPPLTWHEAGILVPRKELDALRASAARLAAAKQEITDLARQRVESAKAYNQLHEQWAAAEQRASQLGNQLESVAGALVDAGTVPAAREDGDYGASVRQVVDERDHALKAHLAQVAAGAVVLKELAAAQERVGELTKALEEIASNTIHFTEIDVVDEDWRKRRAYRALATIAPPAAAAEVAGQEERA